MNGSRFDGVSKVAHIRSDTESPCEECGEAVDGDDFAAAVNHYLQEHAWRLLHTGQETALPHTDDEEAYEVTVAVVGRVSTDAVH